MGEALVRGEAVARVYGNGSAAVTALKDASFEIPDRARIALVGPSGSGKSTLLHLIAGLDRPTAGRIVWPALGTVEQLRPGLVGVAFQGSSLLPQLTVAENVALPLLLAGLTEWEARMAAEEMLRRFAVAEVGDHLPEQISGGQAQRAAVARALVGEPRLVLADEPTGQQDRATGLLMVDTLLDWAESNGAALLVATHDPAVAGRFPTRWSLVDQRLYTEEALRSP